LFPARIKVEEAQVEVPVVMYGEVPAEMAEDSMVEESVVKGTLQCLGLHACFWLYRAKGTIMRSPGDGGRNDG
jgi:hypothetical protein